VRDPGYAGVSAEDGVLDEGVEGAEGEEEGAAEGGGAVGAAGYQVGGVFVGGWGRGRHDCLEGKVKYKIGADMILV